MKIKSTPYIVVYFIGGQHVVVLPFEEFPNGIAFKATVPAENPERRFFAVGNGAWGVLDDAFVTSGIHTFKK